jgi:hypothetical protein
MSASTTRRLSLLSTCLLTLAISAGASAQTPKAPAASQPAQPASVVKPEVREQTPEDQIKALRSAVLELQRKIAQLNYEWGVDKATLGQCRASILEPAVQAKKTEP